MPRPRRFRKEDISDPSNFVHVQHVGFGQKQPSLLTQRSLDLDQENYPSDGGKANPGISGNGESSFDEMSGKEMKVERRIKGSRSSMIPRHHRSTTTCIFPPDTGGGGGAFSPSLYNKISMDKRGSDSPSVAPSLSNKPTFGSLLNLSFLPLGLGKSSSKKRASLLNLTASNLFSSPKAKPEANSESVHMTGYTRRRSFSNSVEDNGVPPPGSSEGANSNTGTTVKDVAKTSNSSRIPLSKLGRSKSTMSEFNKRPKLRLKILPPPPPVPVISKNKRENTADELPSPPPSPVPSPPPSPPKNLHSPPPQTPTEKDSLDAVVKRIPKSPPRSRIIPLPRSFSVESGPNSPQYSTPTGGCSPVTLSNTESAFPLTSPTTPPTCTPFFPALQRMDTPQIWPLQPIWPSQNPPLSIKPIHPTIPEIPSPDKDEMDTLELDSEYDPVVSIVESFLSESEARETLSSSTNAESDITLESLNNSINVPVTPLNVQETSSILQRNISYQVWPTTAQTIFQNISFPAGTSNENVIQLDYGELSNISDRAKNVYECIISKTLEFWVEMRGEHATADELARLLEATGNIDSADALRRSLNSENDGQNGND